ncbi:hypothetical protein ACJJTC_003399 [Scirpophaga incertulas]
MLHFENKNAISTRSTPVDASLLVTTPTAFAPAASPPRPLCQSGEYETYFVPGDVDMLVGASIFPHLLLSRHIQGQPADVAPHALETVLGYVIVGSAPACNTYASVSYCCSAEPVASNDPQVLGNRGGCCSADSQSR